ncbi:MAG: dihydrodipicolinate synthase family protein [Betaproteobacteria bacterium]|nr:dihydrodipicolinate synthase family protein [Betaproteobacteria bacterium]
MPALLTKDDVRGIIPPWLPHLPRTRNSTGHALEPEEVGALVKVAVEEVRGSIPIIAGIITTTTRRAVRYANVAREAGAGAVMVTPPIYQIASPEGLVDYYSAIHRESGMPYIVYNVLPHAPVTPDVYLRLVEQKTGIIGTKRASAVRWRP